jgi:CRP-like cAMP-binding protein
MLEIQELSNFRVFEHMTQSKLVALKDRAAVKEFGPGQCIFNQNDMADFLYGILEGQVELQVVFRDKMLETNIAYEESVINTLHTIDRPLILETLDSGDLFGWSSMVGNERYTTAAMAIEPTRVFAIQAKTLRSILDADPDMGYVFMNHLSKIINDRLNGQIEKLLKSWVEAFGTNQVV